MAMLVECSAIAATEVELEAPCELAEADAGGADGGADGGDTDGGDTDSGASGGGANDGGSAPSEGASLPAPVSPCFDLDDDAEAASGAERWLEIAKPTAMEREEELMRGETAGELRFELLTNDAGVSGGVSPLLLIFLANLFSRHLPEMNVEYITERW